MFDDLYSIESLCNKVACFKDVHESSFGTHLRLMRFYNYLFESSKMLFYKFMHLKLFHIGMLQIINTEWGAFSNGLPLTEFDREMDAESINPGEQVNFSYYYFFCLIKLQ